MSYWEWIEEEMFGPRKQRRRNMKPCSVRTKEMDDLLTRLRWKWVATDTIEEAAATIERLDGALRRIDAINDNPGSFNSDINAVIALAMEHGK